MRAQHARLVALAGGVLLAGCRAAPPNRPEGARAIEGLPIIVGIAPDGSAASAETRGTHGNTGDSREGLYLAHAPFDGEAEVLGFGATLPSFASDGRALAWLASKERGDRGGPGRARAVARGSAEIDLGRSGTPFVVGTASVLTLGAYAPEAGRGGLYETRLDNGRQRTLAADVPPGGFARAADGTVVAVQQPVVGDCRLLRIPAAGPTVVLATGLDRDAARGVLRLDPARRAALVLRARAGNAPALARVEIATKQETPLAAASLAETFDAEGRAWWIEPRGPALVLRHDAPASEVGIVDGAFPRQIIPAGARGAWVLLADRSCAVEPLPTIAPACMRLVAVGDAAPPPQLDTVRRIVTAPDGGFPVVILAGLRSPPAAIAVAAPGVPMLPLGAEATDAAISPDGHSVAAAILLEDGTAVVAADLGTSRLRTVAHGAPQARVFWGGRTLFYTWATFKLWDPFELYDDRNGLYAVVAP